MTLKVNTVDEFSSKLIVKLKERYEILNTSANKVYTKLDQVYIMYFKTTIKLVSYSGIITGELDSFFSL